VNPAPHQRVRPGPSHRKIRTTDHVLTEAHRTVTVIRLGDGRSRTGRRWREGARSRRRRRWRARGRRRFRGVRVMVGGVRRRPSPSACAHSIVACASAERRSRRGLGRRSRRRAAAAGRTIPRLFRPGPVLGVRLHRRDHVRLWQQGRAGGCRSAAALKNRAPVAFTAVARSTARRSRGARRRRPPGLASLKDAPSRCQDPEDLLQNLQRCDSGSRAESRLSTPTAGTSPLTEGARR